MTERDRLVEAAKKFMPRDQFELAVNLTPAELRHIARKLMAEFAQERLTAERKRVEAAIAEASETKDAFIANEQKNIGLWNCDEMSIRVGWRAAIDRVRQILEDRDAGHVAEVHPKKHLPCRYCGVVVEMGFYGKPETTVCKICLDKCPHCEQTAPQDVPGPARTPGQWYCVGHRHLQPRTMFG